MGNFIDLTGQRFVRLLVIKRAPNNGKQTNWFCICDCENIVNVWANNLRNGHTKSCGCLTREKSAERCFLRLTTHGMTKTKTFRAWISMIQRCYNPNNKRYMDYGGRGILVCDRWVNSFENFLEDIGELTTGETLDRKDNDGNYSQENCRLISNKEQQSNRRNNVYLLFNGQNKTVAQWSKYTGISDSTLRGRLKKGWPIEKALTMIAT
jgi:hypothetical protein